MSTPLPRATLATVLVVKALLDCGGDETWCLKLERDLRLTGGTTYTIMVRLEKYGWVSSRWEEVDASEAGRPPRRYYRFNPDCVGVAREWLAAHGSPLRGAWSEGDVCSCNHDDDQHSGRGRGACTGTDSYGQPCGCKSFVRYEDA